MKLWLIVIEGMLLGIALIAGLSAFQIWQTSDISKAGGCQETIVVGKSVNGIEITACRLIGSAINSKNALLVIGTIHGDEPDGKRIVDKLLTQAVSAESEIWVIRDGNPDGAKLITRRNANGVDLNRNFPIKWEPSEPTARTFSGPSPASEPETRALMKAVQLIQPTRIIVFHQPYAQIDCPPDRPTTISDRLSKLTGYKSECIPGEKSGSPTNTYTGTFTIWVNATFPETTAVTFELGLTALDAKFQTIAKAIRTVAAETAYLP